MPGIASPFLRPPSSWSRCSPCRSCGDDEDGAGDGGPTLPAGSGNSGESAPLEREAIEVTMSDNTFNPSVLARHVSCHLSSLRT